MVFTKLELSRHRLYQSVRRRSNVQKHISVGRPKPGVAVHIEAVKAALQDGRLDREAFARSAGVEVTIVDGWIAEDPIQESYYARLWGAAVTSAIPGWSDPRAATSLE